ncbi:MAG: tRNA pseudouridine(38-40) synthase TruA [Lachnospiraceae bacterium]|nr:tRNA pseudouridine(38-40) synthase TruA [Lachnospiraceae bacterium]MBQ8878421.1 tRNA pseudouridine(38-40) synthase TruA [Lachnospiraceae bacterium]
MKRVLLVVAYDGTAYNGWQLQPGTPTIEGELNKALSSLLGEEIRVIGASRTDSGVHALCNIAVFDTNARIPAEKISYALNQRLPEGIRIQKSLEVAEDFHPRHCNSKKTYEYRILNREFPLPTKRLYAHFTYVPLDVELMRMGAKYLVGEHDFKSFCATAAVVETTIRTITDIGVEKDGDEIVIRVSGTGFLYNMVRIIAGTLMEIGRGNYPPQKVQEILAAKDRQAAGPTAPANGLTLVKYEFEGLDVM